MINSYSELDAYRMAMKAAMDISEMTKVFPPEERYSLTDPTPRSSVPPRLRRPVPPMLRHPEVPTLRPTDALTHGAKRLNVPCQWLTPTPTLPWTMQS
jgi:hypothetical protein